MIASNTDLRSSRCSRNFARFARPYLGRNAANTVLALATQHELYVLSWPDRLDSVLPLGELVYGERAAGGLLGVHVPRRLGASGTFVR